MAQNRYEEMRSLSEITSQPRQEDVLSSIERASQARDGDVLRVVMARDPSFSGHGHAIMVWPQAVVEAGRSGENFRVVDGPEVLTHIINKMTEATLVKSDLRAAVIEWTAGSPDGASGAPIELDDGVVQRIIQTIEASVEARDATRH